MDQEIGAIAFIAVTTYLVGSFPTAYIIVRLFAGKNIKDWGTGNVGTLNVHRATNSKRLTALNLAGDLSKGVIAMVVGFAVALLTGIDSEVGISIGGIFAVVGHNYTVFLRFNGGKGIATGLPLLVYLDPIFALLWIAAFLIVVAISRLMVLGQMLATLVVPVYAYIFTESVWAVTVLAALIFVKHAPRILNVVRGTEPKLYYKIRDRQE